MIDYRDSAGKPYQFQSLQKAEREWCPVSGGLQHLNLRLQEIREVSAWGRYGREEEFQWYERALIDRRDLYYSLYEAADVYNSEFSRNDHLENAKRLLGPVDWYLGTLPSPWGNMYDD